MARTSDRGQVLVEAIWSLALLVAFIWLGVKLNQRFEVEMKKHYHTRQYLR